MAEYWFTDTEALRAFGAILLEAGILEDAEDFQNFLDKPFEYNDAYDAWVEADSPSSDDEGWDEFVAALSEDSDESDEA